VWRTGAGVGVLLATWAILAVTGVTCGAEDAGRWDLLLAGHVSISTVVGRHLAVIAAATAVAGVLTTTGLITYCTRRTGRSARGGIALTGMFLAAVGALTAQVFSSRGAASGAAIAVLGGAFAVLMVGEGESKR
jgi:ABC-2 type transport system permease protein